MMRVRSFLMLLAALCLAGPALGASCAIYDMASFRSCIALGTAVDHYSLQNDITCSGSDCCAAGHAMLSINSRNGVTIQGNGYVIARRSSQRVCPAIWVQSSSNLLINALQIDEDESVPRCLGDDKTCFSTIEIRDSTNVTLESVGVYHAKAHGVGANSTNGFVLNNSTISNSGVLGVYIGDAALTRLPSKNVSVTNSVIAHTGTNAVTFWNVASPSPGNENLIRGNVIENNHYVGGYLTDTFKPDFNTGGQVFIHSAQSAVIDNNVIANGRCPTCAGFPPPGWRGTFRGIPAVEVGPGRLTNVRINANKILNHTGAFIFANLANVDSTNAIWNNDSRGVERNFHVRNSSWSPNIGSNPIGNYSPSATWSGAPLYRLYSGGFHQEANFRSQHGSSLHEGTFRLATYPLPRGSNRPIYRCLIWTNTNNDFPSLDPGCESPSFYLHSVLGYSFPPGYPGAQPFYRCLVRSSSTDHFVSWNPNCEGQTFVQALGYAIPQ